MRLLFVIKTLAQSGGGAERVLADITRELARRGHHVTIATFDEEGAESFYPLGAGVLFQRLGIGDVARRTGPFEVIRRMRALRRLLEDSRPDVAIGFMHSSYVPLALAGAGTGIPILGSEHIVYAHFGDRPFERIALRAAAPFLSGIIAVTRSMISDFPRAMRRKMIAIPNPVDVPAPARRLTDGPLRILSVGRLEPQKDHATLIRAFGSIASRYPEWKLRIIGEGSLRGELERLVRELDLASSVEMPGSAREIAAEYSRASLFAMSSRYESFGLATAEALAAGVPAVGFSDCAGTNELIINGVNGLLVDGADRVAALADGLEKLMGSRQERAKLAIAAPATVAHVSLDRIIDSWERVLAGYAKA